VGLGVYDLDAGTTTQVTSDKAYVAVWLSDSRRIVYFANDGWDLVVLDTVSGTRTPVAVRLPAPAINELFGVSPDDRHIYYGALRSEADIWILERR
jgi:hypothetical protein